MEESLEMEKLGRLNNMQQVHAERITVLLEETWSGHFH